MSTEENDPDTLQLLDELNVDWVKLWRGVCDKPVAADELKFIVLTPEKLIQEKPL